MCDSLELVWCAGRPCLRASLAPALLGRSAAPRAISAPRGASATLFAAYLAHCPRPCSTKQACIHDRRCFRVCCGLAVVAVFGLQTVIEDAYSRRKCRARRIGSQAPLYKELGSATAGARVG